MIADILLLPPADLRPLSDEMLERLFRLELRLWAAAAAHDEFLVRDLLAEMAVLEAEARQQAGVGR